MAEPDVPHPYVIGYGSSPSRCEPGLFVATGQAWDLPVPRNELVHMPGSSTTPGRPGTRVAVPVRIAFPLRNGVGAQGMNLYEAQWLAYALPYRRFAAVLTDCDARLGADMDRYSLIVSDLHQLLVAGLPAHCERFWTLPQSDSLLARCRDPHERQGPWLEVHSDGRLTHHVNGSPDR